MNTLIAYAPSARDLRMVTVAAAVALVLLATACAPAPTSPAGASEVRSKLLRLQSDSDLAPRASAAITEAATAVAAAEQPEKDQELAQHRVYIADHKVEIAMAQARTAFAESERAGLSQQRDTARLAARTREADAAANALTASRAEVAGQIMLADAARRQSDIDSRAAELNAAEMQRQLDELNARPTERGLVLTLGDVLFATGQHTLRTGAPANLDKLVAFLQRYEERTAAIEGHTDSVGDADSNLRLSQRRADTVRSYLTGQGIAATRLTAAGMGEQVPVAGNDSAAGRQQNRRVEVIISQASMAASSASAGAGR